MCSNPESCTCEDFLSEEVLRTMSNSFETCIMAQRQQKEKESLHQNQKGSYHSYPPVCNRLGTQTNDNDADHERALKVQGLQAAVQAAVAAESEIYILQNAIANLEDMLQQKKEGRGGCNSRNYNNNCNINGGVATMTTRFPTLTDDSDHEGLDEHGVVGQYIPCDDEEEEENE